MSLSVEEITYRYRGSRNDILRNLSLSFPDKERIVITGKNGCGKTTLARIITGILKPQSGRIYLNERDISDDSLAERGKRIGYVMQNPERQIFSSTVEEEVRYGLENLGLPEEEIVTRTEEYLRYFGIEHHRHDFPFALSHGEKQRLVLAAILAMKPEYLILDEPTASLDGKRKRVLGKYLQQLDCGVIVISHDQSFYEQYCDRVIRLEEYMADSDPMPDAGQEPGLGLKSEEERHA